MAQLSIFLAAIRCSNWKRLYDSVAGATTKDFELIFVSPYELPPELQGIKNVRSIKDFGCPSRCYQLGLLNSEGEYVLWVADDGIFTPNLSIDKAFNHMKGYKNVVSFKYFEGKRTKKSIRRQENENWWHVGCHYMLKDCKYIPKHYFLIMNALIRRDYLMEIGGFDCQFEHLGLGAVDLGVRLQNDGAQVILGEKFMDISHLRGATGDHGPIFFAQTENDAPLFEKMYNTPSSKERTRIDFDNWKLASSVWNRRF